MSLISMLKGDNEDSDKLREIISIVNIDINEISSDIVNSPLKCHYILRDWKLASQLGSAFDYLARFVIKHYQCKVGCKVKNDRYVAKNGLEALLIHTKNKNNNYKSTYRIGLCIILEYINGNDSPQLFERVIGIAVYFAKLENIYRSGYSEEKENALKCRINPYVNQELKNQINLFKEVFIEKFSLDTVNQNIYYNPSFERCSVAVGGADADIIIGDTLIDFKSSKYTKSICEDFKQIVGYLLFNRVLGRDKINKICLYFSRYGKFVEYEFTDKDEKMLELATIKMNRFIEELNS